MLLKVFKIISYLTALLMLAIIIYGINKGFDLTDEGFYLLGYQNYQFLGAKITYFWIPVKILFGWIDLNIITIRIIRLFLTIIGSYALAAGFSQWLTKISGKKTDKWFIFATLLIAGLSSYSIFPHSLSYNSLTTFYIATSMGLIFSALNYEKINYKLVFKLLLAGALMPFLFVTKISTSIIFGVFYGLVLLAYNSKNKFGFNLKRTVIFSTGILLGFCLYFCFFQTFVDFKTGLSISYSDIATNASGHDLMSMFDSILSVIKDSYPILLFSILWVLIFMLIKKTYLHIQANLYFKILVVLLSIPLFIKFVYTACTTFIFKSSGSFLTEFFVLIALLCVVFYIFNFLLFKTKIQAKQIEWIILIFLAISPFAVAFGTNNSLWLNSFFFIGGLFSVVIWFLYKSENPIVYYLLQTIMTCAALWMLIDGFIYSPYNNKPLPEQNLRITSLHNGGMLYDKNVCQLCTKFESVLKKNNFKEGDAIMVSGTVLPGLVYLLGGTSYAGMVFRYEPLTFAENIKNQPKFKKFPIIITPSNFNWNETPKYVESLKSVGIHFPSDYTLSDSIYYETDKVYLNIYFSKNDCH